MASNGMTMQPNRSNPDLVFGLSIDEKLVRTGVDSAKTHRVAEILEAAIKETCHRLAWEYVEIYWSKDKTFAKLDVVYFEPNASDYFIRSEAFIYIDLMLPSAEGQVRIYYEHDPEEGADIGYSDFQSLAAALKVEMIAATNELLNEEDSKLGETKVRIATDPPAIARGMDAQAASFTAPPAKPGRPRNRDDDWAYREVREAKRDELAVFREWLVRIGDRRKTLSNPRDSFRKAIRTRRKEK